MTHVKALQAGHSSQGTSEPITPAKTLRLLFSSGHRQTSGTGDILLISVAAHESADAQKSMSGCPVRRRTSSQTR